MKAGHDSFVSVTPDLLQKYPDAKVLKGKEVGDVITTHEFNVLTGVAEMTVANAQGAIRADANANDGSNGAGPAPRTSRRAPAKAAAKRASGSKK